MHWATVLRFIIVLFPALDVISVYPVNVSDDDPTRSFVLVVLRSFLAQAAIYLPLSCQQQLGSITFRECLLSVLCF